MAVPAGGIPSEVQTGDTVHVAGGQSADYLTGSFVKTHSESSGTVTVVYQDSAGAEQTVAYTSGGGSLSAADRARLSKIPGFTTLFQDFRNRADYPWNLTTNTSFGIFDSAPTNTELEAASYVTSHTYGASDTGFVHIAIRVVDPNDIRNYRIRAVVGSNTYHFEGPLFARQHTVGTTHYFVYEIVNVADGVELTIEERNSPGSETTEYAGQTLAWRQHMSVTNLARNLSGVGATTQAALDHLDDLILGDVHVIDTYGHLPAPSAEYVENAYYIRQNNELYACVNNFTHATPQTGDFNNTSLPNTRRVRRTLDAAFSVPLHTYEYAIDDHHWFQAQGGSFSRDWRQVTPQTALAVLVPTPGDVLHWLGDEDSDADALALIPSVNANTLYVYARTTDLTLRELDNATFAQASAAIDSYEWEIIAGAKADELIPVQTYSDLPAPTKDEVGTLYFVEADDTLYAVIPLTRYGTAATGTFGDPGNRSDFHILGDLPIPPTGYADEWAFSRNRGHFFRANAAGTVWNPSTAQAALDDSRSVNTYAVHFIGQFDTDAEALALTPTISPETDYFFVRTSDNTLRRLTLNTFTAASNPTTFYQWRYATSKVIANPHGVTDGEALAYLQIGSQNYSIGDLSGITTSYRDRYDINEEGGTARATSGHAQTGNIIQAGAEAARLVRLETFVEPYISGSGTPTFSYHVQSATLVSGRYHLGGTLYGTPSGERIEITDGVDQYVVHDFGDSPLVIPADTYAFIALIRHDLDSDDDSGAFWNVSPEPVTGDGEWDDWTPWTFPSINWRASLALVNQGTDFGDHAEVTNLAYQMRVTYEIDTPAKNSVLTPSSGTTVIPNPEDRAGQTELTTIEIAGSIYQISRAPEIVSPSAEGVLYVTIPTAGSGYTAAPTVTITGGGGSGATAEAVLFSDTVNGIRITARGTGYSSIPTVTLSGGAGTGATATAYVGTYSTIVQDFTDQSTQSRMATATFDLARGLLGSDRNLMVHISFNVGLALTVARDFVRSYVTPMPVSDILTIPAIPTANISLDAEFADDYLPSLYLDSTRVDDPGANPLLGANGLWLIKVGGGDANRRFVMARGKNLRSIDNVRFELRA